MGKCLAFEEFELDESRFELRQRGRRVPAQPKVLKLLFHLVANRERGVSEQELLETLWPGVNVGSASVRRAIRGARCALGERGDRESSIRTVRGFGYQFVLPVRELRSGNGAAERGEESAERPSGFRLRATTSAELTAAGEPSAWLVGRQSVLAGLDATLADVLAGRGHNVLITGEPGIGKTRVLHELARRASERGALTWFARCSELEGAPAFWPITQLLRASAVDFTPGELRQLMASGAPDIVRGVPELERILEVLAPQPEIAPQAARFRFFDSMGLFLRRVAERRPLVLLLDDLQHAGEATQRLLLFLVPELERARVLIAATTRPAPQPDAGCAELRAHVARGLAIRTVELEGLTQPEIADYLELRTRVRAPASVVQLLHEQTAGNPLFLEQLLCCVAGDGAELEPCWDRLNQATQRQGLRAAIDRHLELLSPPCRAMLRSAAVLGRELSAALLGQLLGPPSGQAAGASPELVREWLAEATAAGVLHAVPDRLEVHRFAHALIRDALYEQLSAAERSQLHRRAALALEALGAAASDVLLPKLAGHFICASDAEPERAVQYALRAARAARRQLAYEQAAVLLERALDLLDGSAADVRDRLALLLERGEVLGLAGQIPAASACLHHAASLARELGANEEFAAAAVLIARGPEPGSVDPVPLGLLREALGALPETSVQRPGLQALLARSLMYARDPGPCAQLARSARRAAGELADPLLRAEALFACCEAFGTPAHAAERASIGEELALLGHEHGDQSILLRAMTVRIWNSVERGDIAAADSALRSMQSLAGHVRDPFATWRARVYSAMRAFVAGELEQAERLAREARELGGKVADVTAHHVWAVQQNGVLQLQGRIVEAEALVRDVSLRHPGIGGWRAVLARLEAQLGHAERARAVLDQLMARDLDALCRDAFPLSALAPAADLCAAVGDAAHARRLYDAILPYEHHHGIVSMGIATHGPMSRHLGLLAARMGDLRRAREHLENAIAAADAMPSPPFSTICSVSCARALIWDGRSGSRERAKELLARATETARASGLWALARDCRELANGLGVKLGGSGPDLAAPRPAEHAGKAPR